jgi:proteic killer suppression protein
MHFADRDLKRYYEKGNASGIRPDWVRKVRRLLDRLEAAQSPDDLGGPQMGFHRLSGDMAGRYALTVSKNYRMTFAWRDGAAVEIRLEDYHG